MKIVMIEIEHLERQAFEGLEGEHELVYESDQMGATMVSTTRMPTLSPHHYYPHSAFKTWEAVRQLLSTTRENIHCFTRGKSCAMVNHSLSKEGPS